MSHQRPLPLTFPLHGPRLIEASAGTGKTFTLAALYVRLVLQHGGENAFRRRLMPPEILVVTFTEAATRELRNRIRERLAETARFFRGREDRADADAFIAGLLADHDAEDHPRCADLLDAAAQWMDEAAVYTIHSFCNRMLREHAFDSGSLFDLELSQEEDVILENAVRDYWRTFCYPLTDNEADVLAKVAQTPGQLQHEVRPLLREIAGGTGASSLEAILGDLHQRRTRQLEELKTRWAQWADELQALFEQAWNEKRLARKKPQSKAVLGWFDRIRNWARDPQSLDPQLTGTFFDRLDPDDLVQQSDAIDELLAHPALKQREELRKPEQDLPAIAPAVLPHAADWISERVQQHKRQHGVMGFDDMLTRLRAALTGANGDKLARIIREQFPVALIDEFQDTDPIQYEIFHRVYAHQDDIGWFMIGDPKQAIYAFRGADIFTYLRAADTVGANRHTLGENFRSSPELVNSINHVFDTAEQRDSDQGAFLLDHRIPFEPVAPRGGGKEAFRIDGQAHAALTFWHLRPREDSDDTCITKGEYLERMARGCAAEMTRLLNLGRQGKARLHDGENGAIQPADMAVLVRSGAEAQIIREALAGHGVRSVYLSDKDNVLTTPEADDVMLWLAACAEPESERAVRAALAGATLDYSWARLEALSNDERQWEDTVDRFRDYRRRWQRQGVLAMLRHLLHDHGIPQRLLNRSDGERSLTNLLHLSELLQQAATHLDGEQALIRWFAEERQAANERQASDEQIMRLESDADLVKVITIHKAKGLEYPLVFLPFICGFRPVKPDELPVRYHDDREELQLSLEPDEAVMERAERERLAEDMRLLYVAMTRAKHACWLGMAPLRVGGSKHEMHLHHSAMGHLLDLGADDGPDELDRQLRALTGDTTTITLTPAPEPDDEQLQAPAGDPGLGEARAFTGLALERWWVASYSALQHDTGRQAPPDSAREEDYREEAPMPAGTPKHGSDNPLHDFPAGPMAGTFLHGLLEVLADLHFEAGSPDEGEFAEALHQRLAVRRWDDWHRPLHEWMRALVETPLPLGEAEVALKQLQPNAVRPELEFLFPVHQVPAAELDRVIRTHVRPGEDRPPLAEEHLNGMLKGFIDLVFEHDGRYYVMDYKSNRLGDDDSAYTEAAMRETVLEKRYDVQYSLYLLALHRLLRARLGAAYDYDRHIGGSAYYFLRGIHADSRGLFFERPPKELMDAMDALFRGEVTYEARGARSEAREARDEES